MKRVLYLVLICISYCFFSCKENNLNYPIEIKKANLTEEFDKAKFELYLLYLKCAPEKYHKEILSSDIEFFALDTIDSSVVILYQSSELENISAITDCHYYNGIGFDSKSNVSTIFWGESVALDYNGVKDSEKEEILNEIILPNSKVLTPWLNSIISKR